MSAAPTATARQNKRWFPEFLSITVSNTDMRLAANMRQRLLLLCTAVFLLNAAAAWGDCCQATAKESVEAAAGMPCDHGDTADTSHEHNSDCCISCVVAQVSSVGTTPIATAEPMPLVAPLPLLARPGLDPPYRPPNFSLS